MNAEDNTDSRYKRTAADLRSQGIRVKFQHRHQLIAWNGSNSCWLTQLHGIWYVATWAPRIYRIPDRTDLVCLVQDCFSENTKTMQEIPANIVKRYRLELLDGSDALAILSQPLNPGERDARDTRE